MPCDECVNRREFLARAAAGGAVGALLAACGDGQIGGALAPSDRSAITITVSDFPALANVGELAQVGPFQAARRTGAASFDAFDMTCKHAGCLTIVTAGTRFDCPCHGSRFSSTGAVLRGPAQDPLTQLTTSYDPASDQLTIG